MTEDNYNIPIVVPCDVAIVPGTEQDEYPLYGMTPHEFGNVSIAANPDFIEIEPVAAAFVGASGGTLRWVDGRWVIIEEWQASGGMETSQSDPLVDLLPTCEFCGQPVAKTNPGYLYYGQNRKVWHEQCLYKQVGA